MASHVVVISTDLRRATIKVTPSTYLIDVLQEACKKLSLSSDKYLMKHKQKNVELAVPFRASGLTGGAKLELVVKSNTPSAIQIALQLPQPEAKDVPGGRLIKKFPSDLTIWKILRQFESGDASAGRNINITARGVAQTAGAEGTGAGQLYYETPVLNIMGRDFSTFTDFQKTMSQLGHNSGNVLIRLTFKTTSQTLFEAMNEIGKYFKDSDIPESSPSSADAGVKAPVPETSQPSTDVPMADAPAVDEQAPTESIQVEELKPAETPAQETPQNPYDPINVFLAPNNTVPAAANLPLDDTDFTPTVAHAQLHQARLQESSRNRRLPSDQELEEKAAAEAAKVAAIKSVLVRVRFPDNTSSDWQIEPSSTGAFLYEAVRHVMAAKDEPFHLVLSGGTTVIKDDSSEKHNLIRSYKLSGRVLVNLIWNDKVSKEIRKQPFLLSNIARQGQEITMPALPEPIPDSENEVVARVDKKERKATDGDGKKKIPKWLKLGKK